MLKKPIKFEDFDGVERTEIHYFNLSKSDFAKLEATYDEGRGYLAFIRRAAETGADTPALVVELFETLIKYTYGVRSEDGNRFFKSPELYAQFKATPAYDALFMELISDASAGAIFLNGVLPVSLKQSDEEIQRALAMSPEELAAELAKTPEQLMRERAAAQMQGHLPKQAEPQRVAEPLVEPPAVTAPTFQPPVQALPYEQPQGPYPGGFSAPLGVPAHAFPVTGLEPQGHAQDPFQQ